MSMWYTFGWYLPKTTGVHLCNKWWHHICYMLYNIQQLSTFPSNAHQSNTIWHVQTYYCNHNDNLYNYKLIEAFCPFNHRVRSWTDCWKEPHLKHSSWKSKNSTSFLGEHVDEIFKGCCSGSNWIETSHATWNQPERGFQHNQSPNNQVLQEKLYLACLCQSAFMICHTQCRLTIRSQ